MGPSRVNSGVKLKNNTLWSYKNNRITTIFTIYWIRFSAKIFGEFQTEWARTHPYTTSTQGTGRETGKCLPKGTATRQETFVPTWGWSGPHISQVLYRFVWWWVDRTAQWQYPYAAILRSADRSSKPDQKRQDCKFHSQPPGQMLEYQRFTGSPLWQMGPNACEQGFVSDGCHLLWKPFALPYRREIALGKLRMAAYATFKGSQRTWRKKTAKQICRHRPCTFGLCQTAEAHPQGYPKAASRLVESFMQTHLPMEQPVPPVYYLYMFECRAGV